MKKFLDKSQLIGITEASEIAFNLDAFDYLYDGNIIITKRQNCDWNYIIKNK